MGVDELGVDKMGSRRSGNKPVKRPNCVTSESSFNICLRNLTIQRNCRLTNRLTYISILRYGVI